MNSAPLSDREYVYTMGSVVSSRVFLTRPSSPSSFNLVERVFGVIPATLFLSSLNRFFTVISFVQLKNYAQSPPLANDIDRFVDGTVLHSIHQETAIIYRSISNILDNKKISIGVIKKCQKDILEKGAIVQRDKETFAIAPHIPGGIATPDLLRKIADVSEKYGAAAIKVTSAQRLAIVGLKEDDLDNAWDDLGIKPGAAIGLCVRSVKICPGTTFCKRGQQDAVGLGLKLDEKYHGMELPSKLKMGVSGCMNSCAESAIKDIGIMGTPKGFTVMVGGSAGLKPRLADTIAEELDEDEVLSLVDTIISFYKSHSKKQRIGKVIEEIGLDTFKKEVGL